MSSPSPYDNNELLLRIAKGDETAMKTLFTTFYPRLRYFAYDLIKDQGEAQDIAQEALVVFWQRREDFKNATLAGVGAFLFKVARNRCYDFNKHLFVRKSKESQIADNRNSLEDILEARLIKEDLFNRVYQEILQLPPSQLRLLKMIYVQGLKTHEIVDILNTTPNNVRNQKARALKQLHAILIKKGFLLTDFIFLSILCDAIISSVVI